MEKNQLKLECKSKDKCKGYIVYNKGDNINKGYLCRDNWSGTLNNYDKTDTYECEMNCECPEGYTEIKCDPKTGIAICKPPVDLETDNKIQDINNKIITLEGDITTNKTNYDNNISRIQNLENKQVKNIIYKKKTITRHFYSGEMQISNYDLYEGIFKLNIGDYFENDCPPGGTTRYTPWDVKIDGISYAVENYNSQNESEKIYKLNENLKDYKSISLNLMETEKLTVDINSLTTYIINIDNNNVKYKYINIKYSITKYVTLFGPDNGYIKIRLGFYSNPNYNEGKWYFKIEEQILNNSYTESQVYWQNYYKNNTAPTQDYYRYRDKLPFKHYNSYDYNLYAYRQERYDNILYKNNSKEDDIWYFLPRINYDRVFDNCSSALRPPKNTDYGFMTTVYNQDNSGDLYNFNQLGKKIPEHAYSSDLYKKQEKKELIEGTELVFLNIANIYYFDLVLKFCNNKLIISGVPNGDTILILESN